MCETGKTSYDVIIAGASFAGLAVASRLRGARVLLLDRKPVGEGQTSACAAPLVTLARMRAEEAILQVHDALVIHTRRGTAVWQSGIPFATFDYRRFCTAVLERLAVDVETATALRVSAGAVATTAGVFMAPLMVDATGWRAAVAGSLRPDYVRRRVMGVGLETELPVAFPPGLHFCFDSDLIRPGYAWAFPAGDRTRFGVASAGADAKLRVPLERFLEKFGLQAGPRHGGFLASGLRDPVVDGVFVVGDAAGQCLPLTGEGIRMAVRAGWYLGNLLQMVIDGELPRLAAEEQYRSFVGAQRRHYAALAGFQFGLLQAAPRLLGPASQIMTGTWPLRTFFKWYMNIFQPPGWPADTPTGRRMVSIQA